MSDAGWPNWSALVSRWLHIMAACTAVGGTIFALLVVLPAAGVLAPEAREAFHAAARQRWSKIVMAAIAILLVTGLYNFFTINTIYKRVLPDGIDPVFGIKFFLAFAVFAIASLLVGRTALAQRLRTNARLLAVANLLLAALIIAISGVMRTTHPAVRTRAGDRVGQDRRPGRSRVGKPAARASFSRARGDRRGQEGQEEDRRAARPNHQVAAAVGRR